MVILVAFMGSWYYTDIFDVAGVDCCKLSKRSLKSLQFLFGKKPGNVFMELCPLASVDGLPYHCYLLFTAVLCCLYLGIQKHSECLGLSPCVRFVLRGYHAGLRTRFISSSQRIGFGLQVPVAGSQQKCCLPSSSWFYFSGKPLQHVLTWVNGHPCSLQLSSIHGKITSRSLGEETDKTIIITVWKCSFNYPTWFYYFFFRLVNYICPGLGSGSPLNFASGLMSPNGLNPSMCWEWFTDGK